MQEAGETRPSARAARCANHGTIVAVGVCTVCGKAICVSCAIPVRGRLVCHECLPTVLVHVAVAPSPPAPIARGADIGAAVGFGLVLLSSVFPWTRFGDRSGFLEAWLPHWSLLAASAAAVGLAAAITALRRPVSLRTVAAAYSALAVVVGVAVVLHRRHPPGSPLATASGIPWLAVLGAVIALAGGLAKGWAALVPRRATLTGSRG